MKSIMNGMANAMAGNVMTRKRRAVSAIVGIMLGLGLTAVAAGGLYVMTSDLSDSAVSISSVEIQNVRAYNTGNEAYMSLSVKNTGTDAVTVNAVELLLDCDETNDGTAADQGDECGDDAATSVPSPQVAVPGGLASTDLVTSDIVLAPGATASESGTIKAADGTKVVLALGQEYLVEIEGVAASGEPVIQTATVRPR